MSLIIQKWKLKFVFAGCGIPQCDHTLLVLVCFVFQITVCYLDRSQLSPRNQFLFITAVSAQPVLILSLGPWGVWVVRLLRSHCEAVVRLL